MQQLSTNTFGPAKFIVTSSATPWLGTHTSIASAITSAAALGAPQTIYLLTGTYTENITLQPGINLSAWGSDSSQGGSGNVIISGKLTMTAAGTCSLFGIQLQTNSDYLIEVTGSVASRVELTDCYLNCSNNTGIHFTSSSSGSYISLLNCNGDIGTTGISLFTSSSPGQIYLNDSFITNSGGSTTPSDWSAGYVQLQYCNLAFGLAPSVTGAAGLAQYCYFGLAYTAVTTSGTAFFSLQYSVVISGSQSCCSAGAGTSIGVAGCYFASSNTNVMTGAGTISYKACFFQNSKTVNATTTIATSFEGLVGHSPEFGSLGYQVRSYIAPGSAITLTTATPANITSIGIPAGTWDVSAIGGFNGTITGTRFDLSINNTSATLSTNFGDQSTNIGVSPTVGSDVGLSIPSFRVFLTTPTTYYLVAEGTFTIGTLTAYGRISATRVG